MPVADLVLLALAFNVAVPPHSLHEKASAYLSVAYRLGLSSCIAKEVVNLWVILMESNESLPALLVAWIQIRNYRLGHRKESELRYLHHAQALLRNPFVPVDLIEDGLDLSGCG